MKKITYLIAFALVSLSIRAQSPYPTGPDNNSVIPNFNLTDVNGVAHNLYSYLNAGKSCFIEMGGVYCNPSWQYHNSGQMADFYYAYGPLGSDEVMVFWVETSTYCSLNDLVDTTDNQNFGNWLEGTPFPMVLSAALYNYFTDNTVPDIWRICPDKKIWKYYLQSPTQLKNIMNSQCGILTGVQNHARIMAPQTENGFSSGTVNFKVWLRNYGTNNITSAVLKLKENGVVVATKTFSNIVVPQFGTANLAFDAISLNPSATYTTEIQSINNVANRVDELSSVNLPFHTSVVSARAIKVKVHTENCPQTMYWQITNSSGSSVYTGGPYEGFNGNCGGPNAETIINHNINLPDANDSYNLTLYSTGGLGWKNYAALQTPGITPGIRVLNGTTVVYSQLNVGNFGSSITYENFLTVDTTLASEDFERNDITIYPNPSTGIINIDTVEPVGLAVFDLMGKQVFSAKNIDSNTTVDLSQLGSGVYIAKIINADGAETIKKISLTN